MFFAFEELTNAPTTMTLPLQHVSAATHLDRLRVSLQHRTCSITLEYITLYATVSRIYSILLYVTVK